MVFSDTQIRPPHGRTIESLDSRFGASRFNRIRTRVQSQNTGDLRPTDRPVTVRSLPNFESHHLDGEGVVDPRDVEISVSHDEALTERL